MTDLAEWLLAAIADDEQVAREATAGPWTVHTIDGSSDVYADGQGVASDREGGCASQDDAEHIARWDPKRVLAECDAKRRVVAEHVQTDYGPERWGQVRLPPPDAVRGELTGARVYNCSTCDPFDRDYGPGEHAGDGCTTLRLLALPYASRVGYQAEWAL